MKRIGTTMFTVVVGLGLACSSFGTSESEEDDPVVLEEDAAEADESEAVTIEKITLARERGKNLEPVEKFSGSDTFCLLVKLSDAATGTRVKAVWIAVDAGGKKNQKIFEKVVTLDAKTMKEVKEPSRIDFCLSHDEPYPAGKYKADIYLDDEKAKTVAFKVE